MKSTSSPPPEQTFPIRPYLLNAYYDWININQWTPYIAVNTLEKDVCVPEQFIENNKIILNISPTAIREFHIDHGHYNLTFRARFSGIEHQIFIPIVAIMAIFAAENNHKGIVFEPEDFTVPQTEKVKKPPSTSDKKSEKRKPHLRLVKE